MCKAQPASCLSPANQRLHLPKRRPASFYAVAILSIAVLQWFRWFRVAQQPLSLQALPTSQYQQPISLRFNLLKERLDNTQTTIIDCQLAGTNLHCQQQVKKLAPGARWPFCPRQDAWRKAEACHPLGAASATAMFYALADALISFEPHAVLQALAKVSYNSCRIHFF